MINLPTPDLLAELVSNVTRPMFGISFALAPESPGNTPFQGAEPYRTLLLGIEGSRPLTVAIAADRPGAKMLGGVMFGCPPDDVDVSMIEDALGELLNIFSAQVKKVLDLDERLGLPRVAGPAETLQRVKAWRSATLRSGTTNVTVWVAVAETEG